MLGRHAHALALDTLHHGGADGAGDEGVFRVIFKVAAAKRRAVQVHAGTEDDVDAKLQGLIADGLAYLAHQLSVPRRGQAGADGKSRGRIVVGVVLALGVDVHAGRAVGHAGLGDTQAGNAHRSAGGTGHEFLLMAQHGAGANKAVITTAHQQLGFLFKGHGGYHLVDVGSRKFGLCVHRHYASHSRKGCRQLAFHVANIVLRLVSLTTISFIVSLLA